MLPERTGDPEWKEAIDVYRSTYAELENLDPRLSKLAYLFARAGSDAETDFEKTNLGALSRAGAQYRRSLWPADDKRNREWIERVTPLIERWGESMSEEIARANETSWPKKTVRVEVVAFVDPFGGQTTDAPSPEAPPMTIISSVDPGYAGDASLEMLFHESSHLFDDQLRNAIAEESRSLGAPEPEGLWHALLFYTAGYYAKQHLGERYVVYGDAQGVFKRGSWEKMMPAIVNAWEPHLRQETTMHEAIRKVLEKLKP